MKTLKEYTSTKEGKEQLEKKIERILKDFDFEKVHEVMKYLNWKWYLFEIDDMGIPYIRNLKNVAERLLRSAVSSPTEYGRSATGGFVAEAVVIHDIGEDPDDFENAVDLSLLFYVDEVSE